VQIYNAKGLAETRRSQKVGSKLRLQFKKLNEILKDHFPSVDEKKMPHEVHYFISEKDAALYESWNYDQQQDLLARLRGQLRQASDSLSKIQTNILYEVSTNLTLPLEVLNGTHDRKTCADEVFDLAPKRTEVEDADQVFKGLLAFGKNIELAIKYTQDELPRGISVRNRNIEAWRIVEAAVGLCRRNPDSIKVPKKINGSGPMRRLLINLFEHYNIDANVDAAFNGWAKHIDKKRESLDLLPI
jgi:hypothetical protein